MANHTGHCLCKRALVQDATYGTLLRELRLMLHARIAENVASLFTDIAVSQPELLARQNWRRTRFKDFWLD
jgi:hypothetical protein